MDFVKYRVISKAAGLPVGAFLELDAMEQAKPRRSALKLFGEIVGGRGVYEIMKTVCFKHGEVFGYYGQKISHSQCEQIDVEEKAETDINAGLFESEPETAEIKTSYLGKKPGRKSLK